MHDAVRKAAIKDQEVAGVDVVSPTASCSRDNMIDYFAERLPGVQVDHTGTKSFYYDFYEQRGARSKLRHRAARSGPDEVRFLEQFSIRRGEGLHHRAALRSSSASATSTTRARRRSRSTSRGC